MAAIGVIKCYRRAKPPLPPAQAAAAISQGVARRPHSANPCPHPQPPPSIASSMSKRARDDDDDVDYDVDVQGQTVEDSIALAANVRVIQPDEHFSGIDHGLPPSVPGLDEDDAEDQAPTLEEDDFDQDCVAREELEKWQLGEGFTPVPPSDSRSAVNSDWAEWGTGMQGKLRACRHLVMGRTIETRDVDQSWCSYKGYSDAALNERVAATAAIEGALLDPEAKGLYIDGQNLLQQYDLPDDEEKRKQAIKAMDPLEAYLYVHHYRQKVDEAGNPIEHEPQYAPDDPVPGTKNSKYTAPCSIVAVEPVFGKKKDGNGDTRGDIVGTRTHKFIFNPRYSLAAYVAKNMTESNLMHRAGRAMRAPNVWRGRNVGPERAAKQQRLMVADADVNATSSMKFARIWSNSSLVHHLNSAAGSEAGGQSRNVYPSMQDALGNASLSQEMKAHPTLGSLHALSPEWTLNGRAGAAPPKNLFPKDKYPELQRPETKDAVGRAYVAFMVTMDGLLIEVDPVQTNPNNYMDDDGFIVFPYPDTVYWLSNYQVPLRDATMPLVLSLGAPIGEKCWKPIGWSTRTTMRSYRPRRRH